MFVYLPSTHLTIFEQLNHFSYLVNYTDVHAALHIDRCLGLSSISWFLSLIGPYTHTYTNTFTDSINAIHISFEKLFLTLHNYQICVFQVNFWRLHWFFCWINVLCSRSNGGHVTDEIYRFSSDEVLPYSPNKTASQIAVNGNVLVPGCVVWAKTAKGTWWPAEVSFSWILGCFKIIPSASLALVLLKLGLHYWWFNWLWNSMSSGYGRKSKCKWSNCWTCFGSILW